MTSNLDAFSSYSYNALLLGKTPFDDQYTVGVQNLFLSYYDSVTLR